MRARLTFGWLVVLSLVAAIGYAQTPPAPAAQGPVRTLSLAEALDIALHSNPSYLSALNDRGAAAWARRSAQLNLFTPSASISGAIFKAGDRSIPGEIRSQPGLTQRSYSFDLNYNLSGQTITAPGQANANLRAVEENAAFERTRISGIVRTNYLNALQAVAQEDLAQRSFERARENHALASARNQVGQGTLIDVRRAEVAQGQAEVGVLRATQNVQNEQLRLFQVLGVPKPEGLVQLTDTFPVTAPAWNADQVMAMALEQNPDLRALRAQQTAAHWDVRAARSRYLPSLNFSAGFDGQRTSTTVFDTLGNPSPASFGSKNPWSFRVGASLPLYDGFSRTAQVSQARARDDDMRQLVRARELQVRTEVASSFHALDLAYRTIDIQRRNRDASSEALELATQRYRVGSGTYIELLDARVEAERAASEYISAVYEYHRSIAALETAVGRPLR